MAMVDEKWGRNQQVAAYDSFAILRPSRRAGRGLWASRADDARVCIYEMARESIVARLGARSDGDAASVPTAAAYAPVVAGRPATHQRGHGQ